MNDLTTMPDFGRGVVWVQEWVGLGNGRMFNGR
jgi:hypothetical protein